MLKKILAPLMAFLSLLLGLMSTARAALPEGVGTAITGAQTDGLAAIGLLAGAGAAIYIIYRVLKRLGVVA